MGGEWLMQIFHVTTIDETGGMVMGRLLFGLVSGDWGLLMADAQGIWGYFWSLRSQK
jgi:hypothetical protein